MNSTNRYLHVNTDCDFGIGKRSGFPLGVFVALGHMEGAPSTWRAKEMERAGWILIQKLLCNGAF